MSQRLESQMPSLFWRRLAILLLCFSNSSSSALMCRTVHWCTFVSSSVPIVAWMTVCCSALTMALLMPSTILSALSFAATKALKAVRSRWTVCFKLPCMPCSSSFSALISPSKFLSSEIYLFYLDLTALQY